MNDSVYNYFRRRVRHLFNRGSSHYSSSYGHPRRSPYQRVRRRTSNGSLRTLSAGSDYEGSVASGRSVGSSVRSWRRRMGMPHFVRPSFVRSRRRQGPRRPPSISSDGESEVEPLAPGGTHMTHSSSSPRHPQPSSTAAATNMGASLSVPPAASSSSSYSPKSQTLTQSPSMSNPSSGSGRRKPPPPPGPPSLASQTQHHPNGAGAANSMRGQSTRNKTPQPVSQMYDSRGRSSSMGPAPPSVPMQSSGLENLRPFPSQSGTPGFNNPNPNPNSNPAQLSPLPHPLPYSYSHPPTSAHSSNPMSPNMGRPSRNSFNGNGGPALPPKSPHLHVNDSGINTNNSSSNFKSPPITRVRNESTSSESDMLFARNAAGATANGAIPVTFPTRRGERERVSVSGRERKDSHERRRSDERDRDRDRERERKERERRAEGHRERERDREREREKERLSSSTRRPPSSQSRYPSSPGAPTHHINLNIPPQAPSSSSGTTSSNANPSAVPNNMHPSSTFPPSAVPRTSLRPSGGPGNGHQHGHGSGANNKPLRNVTFRDTLFFSPTPPGSIPASPEPSVRTSRKSSHPHSRSHAPPSSHPGGAPNVSTNRGNNYGSFTLGQEMTGQDSSGESSETPNGASGYYTAPSGDKDRERERDRRRGDGHRQSSLRISSQPVGSGAATDRERDTNTYPRRSHSSHHRSSSTPATSVPKTSYIPPPRRTGWFNAYGDQLWTNSGGFVAPPPGFENPPDLVGYPKRGEGWMNDKGRVIDVNHRLVRIVDFGGVTVDEEGVVLPGGHGGHGMSAGEEARKREKRSILKSALKKTRT